MKLTIIVLALCALVSASQCDELSNKSKNHIKKLEDRYPELKESVRKDWSGKISKVNRGINDDTEMRNQAIRDNKKYENTYNVGTSAFKCSSSSSTSSSIPTSVHKLRPGDIRVIAALGDSLTAGNGILARSVLGLLVQYRGNAFTIGGEHDLKKQVTIPNILKQFNRDIYGHSTASGSVGGVYSKLNMAEPGRKAVDMPQQARNLIKKLKSDSKIDYQKDWKLVNLLVGGNDLCDYCKDKGAHSTANYKKHIQEALDILHREVPRVFVNLMETVDAGLVEELKSGSSTCGALLGSMLCRCIAKPSSDKELQEIRDTVKDYHKAVRELADSRRYDTREDFTVVSQPFFRNTEPPRINGKYDLSFFAPDCFHFSAKGHAEAARALWNNMLEPVGSKSDRWNLNGSFNCPTKVRPYFATHKN